MGGRRFCRKALEVRWMGCLPLFSFGWFFLCLFCVEGGRKGNLEGVGSDVKPETRSHVEGSFHGRLTAGQAYTFLHFGIFRNRRLSWNELESQTELDLDVQGEKAKTKTRLQRSQGRWVEQGS